MKAFRDNKNFSKFFENLHYFLNYDSYVAEATSSKERKILA